MPAPKRPSFNPGRGSGGGSGRPGRDSGIRKGGSGWNRPTKPPSGNNRPQGPPPKKDSS
jgi:hypothetical protein